MSENQILRMKFENVSLGYASLATPYEGKPDPVTGKKQDPKYRIEIILEPNDPQVKTLREKMRAAIVNKFGDKAPLVQEQIVTNNRLPLHRGDVDRAGKPAYAGKLFLTATNKEQPTIVVFDKSGVQIATRGTPEVLTPAHPNYPYGGCRADVYVTIKAYEYTPTNTKGVSAYVDGVMFRKHGTPIRGAAAMAVSEFTPPPAEDADEAAPPAAAGDGLL